MAEFIKHSSRDELQSALSRLGLEIAAGPKEPKEPEAAESGEEAGEEALESEEDSE